MEWAKLLSTEKLSSEPPEPDSFKEYPINAFEKDYSRIVSSAAFRRLQDKTQVFPLDNSDFIRTRLTHSIEVSTIARQLGIMISKNTTQYKPTDIAVPEDAEAIASVLLCAGLLHDLGNPPFGHFGETVIGDWFKENLDHVKYKGQPLRSWLSAQMIADLENFEGNAQALRILLKAKHGSSLNLSKAIISTLVKYPTDSCSVDKGSADIRKHKLGFFAAEQETFEQISEAVGTTTPDKGIVRHPLTYLLEAADDIAYSTADLEDAFKKGLFTLDQFIEYYTNSYDHSKIVPHRSPEYFSDERIQELSALRGADHTPENDSAAFKKWLTQTRQWLMYVAIYRFSCKYKEIMAAFADCGAQRIHGGRSGKGEDGLKIVPVKMSRWLKAAAFENSVGDTDCGGTFELELLSGFIIIHQERAVNDVENVTAVVIPVGIHQLAANIRDLLGDSFMPDTVFSGKHF